MLEVVHASLPMDNSVWRVEWYGALSRNPGAPLEYSISVHFRKFTQVGRAPMESEVTSVRVGVGAICSLPLGSLWQAGRLVGFSDRTTVEYTIDLSTGNRRGGPLNRELFGRSKNGAYHFGSLEVPHKAGDERVVRYQISRSRPQEGRLMIPCFEVARAWFLRDSELTLRLLSAPIGEAIDYLHDRTQTRIENGKLLLALKPGVNASAVPLVAALILDPHFAKCAGTILSTVVAHHQTGRPKILFAVPPLERVCRLRAAGEWGNTGGKRAFFVHWLTAVELPELPPIEWFRSDASEGESGEVEDEGRVRAVGVPTREVVRILHQLDPSSRERVMGLFAKGAEWINPPKIERRPLPIAEVVARTPEIVTEEPLDIVPSVDASTAPPTTSGEGPARAKYVTLPAADETLEQRFMPASFDRMIAVAHRIADDPEMAVRTTGGSFYLDDVSGFRRTLLGFAPRWALVSGRPRQALCLEIEWNGGWHYVFEVERRVEREELSACLLGKLDRSAFTQSDVDRILSAYAKARGSWRMVHKPFWFRTLAHKFKDEMTFSARVRDLIRARMSTGGGTDTSSSTEAFHDE